MPTCAASWAKRTPLLTPSHLPPTFPYPPQAVPASPVSLPGSRQGQSSLLHLPIRVKGKCSTKIDTKIEFWVHWPSFTINITAMKCQKIKAALSIHTCPPPPLLSVLPHARSCQNKASRCLFSLYFKYNCFQPPFVNKHGRKGFGKKKQKNYFKNPS